VQYQMLALSLLGFMAVPASYLAYLIGVKKKVYLISGWENDELINADAYASTFSLALVVMALFLAVSSIALYTEWAKLSDIGALIIVAIATPMVAGSYCNFRYGKKLNSSSKA